MAMAEQQYQRQTAHIISIGEFLSRHFVKKEGMEPSYILGYGEEKIARVNILGIILDIQDEVNPSLIVEDGTGRVRCRAFEELPALKHLKVGDRCLIIGKPREYSSENYVVPEILAKVMDTKMVEWRKLQLIKRDLLFGKETEEMPKEHQQRKLPSTEEEKSDDETETVEEEVGQEAALPYEKLLSFIKDHDKGDGVEKAFIIGSSGIQDAGPILEKMLLEGEIFEIRPGKLKVL